jgi:hypothetical protein
MVVTHRPERRQHSDLRDGRQRGRHPHATAGNAGGTLTPGPIAVPFIVPAGVTSCYIWFKANMPVGTRAKFRFGCADVIDMTTLGDIEIYA